MRWRMTRWSRRDFLIGILSNNYFLNCINFLPFLSTGSQIWSRTPITTWLSTFETASPTKLIRLWNSLTPLLEKEVGLSNIESHLYTIQCPYAYVSYQSNLWGRYERYDCHWTVAVWNRQMLIKMAIYAVFVSIISLFCPHKFTAILITIK